MSNVTINAAKIAREVANTELDDGEALYLVNGEVVAGHDGNQPSNSLCLLVGPADPINTMAAEIEQSIEAFAADRGYTLV